MAINKFGIGGCCCIVGPELISCQLRGEQGLAICLGTDRNLLTDHHYVLTEIYGCYLDGRYLLEFYDYDYSDYTETIKLRRKRSGEPVIEATAHFVDDTLIRFDSLYISGIGTLTGGFVSDGFGGYDWMLTGEVYCCPTHFLLSTEILPLGGFLCTSRLYDGLYEANNANWQATSYLSSVAQATYDFDLLDDYNEWDGWIYDCDFNSSDVNPYANGFQFQTTFHFLGGGTRPEYAHGCGTLTLQAFGGPVGSPIDFSVAVGCTVDAAYSGDPGWDPATEKHKYLDLQTPQPNWTWDITEN